MPVIRYILDGKEVYQRMFVREEYYFLCKFFSISI